jgi:hypothetical protein
LTYVEQNGIKWVIVEGAQIHICIYVDILIVC